MNISKDVIATRKVVSFGRHAPESEVLLLPQCSVLRWRLLLLLHLKKGPACLSLDPMWKKALTGEKWYRSCLRQEPKDLWGAFGAFCLFHTFICMQPFYSKWSTKCLGIYLHDTNCKEVPKKSQQLEKGRNAYFWQNCTVDHCDK